MSLLHTAVPDFSAPAFHQDEIVTIKHDNLLGHWSLFFFYPGDFTFVCPTEFEDLALHYDEFVKLHVEIYSVSTDSQFVHQAWHSTSPAVGRVRFPMLSDRTGNLCRIFDVYNEDAGTAQRGSFIINPEGVICSIEISDGSVGRNAQETLRKIQALQFISNHPDTVCPAHWNPGDATLKPSLNLVGKL